METHKVQFTFTSQALEDLDLLKEQVGAPSRAETIRYALKLMQWIANETAKGRKLCLETEEGIKELIIPFVTTKKGTLDSYGEL